MTPLITFHLGDITHQKVDAVVNAVIRDAFGLCRCGAG